MKTEKISAPVTRITKGPLHHFFGYYDKSPWNSEGRYLLAMESSFANHNPRHEDVLVLGRIDLQGDQEEMIHEQY